MRGSIRLPVPPTDEYVERALAMVADRLRAARPSKIKISHDSIFVRGGFFRFVGNWNLLVGITTLTIRAKRTPKELTLCYSATFWELAGAVLVASTFFFLAVGGAGPEKHPYSEPLLGLAVRRELRPCLDSCALTAEGRREPPDPTERVINPAGRLARRRGQSRPIWSEAALMEPHLPLRADLARLELSWDLEPISAIRTRRDVLPHCAS